MKTAFIYCLSDPLSGAVRYIGKTTNPKNRLRKHLSRDENNHKMAWIKNLASRGLKPAIEVIDSVVFTDESEWEEVEMFWISYLRFLGCNLTNLQTGGNGGRSRCQSTIEKQKAASRGRKASLETRMKISAALKGMKRSPETRKRMSESMLKRGPTRINFTHPQETRDKIRKTLTGTKRPQSVIDKVRAALTGRTIPDHVRLKISIGNSGKSFSPDTRRRMSQARRDRETAKYEKRLINLNATLEAISGRARLASIERFLKKELCCGSGSDPIQP